MVLVHETSHRQKVVRLSGGHHVVSRCRVWASCQWVCSMVLMPPAVWPETSDRKNGKVQPAVPGFSTFSFSPLPISRRLSLPEGRSGFLELQASGWERAQGRSREAQAQPPGVLSLAVVQAGVGRGAVPPSWCKAAGPLNLQGPSAQPASQTGASLASF